MWGGKHFTCAPMHSVDTCIITDNINKGNGTMIASILCCNSPTGNFDDNCYCIGHAEGPIFKGYNNLYDAFFKGSNPVGKFLNELTSNILSILTITLPIAKKQKRHLRKRGASKVTKNLCRSIVFKSINHPNSCSISMDSAFVNEDDAVFCTTE